MDPPMKLHLPWARTENGDAVPLHVAAPGLGGWLSIPFHPEAGRKISPTRNGNHSPIYEEQPGHEGEGTDTNGNERTYNTNTVKIYKLLDMNNAPGQFHYYQHFLPSLKLSTAANTPQPRIGPYINPSEGKQRGPYDRYHANLENTLASTIGLHLLAYTFISWRDPTVPPHSKSLPSPAQKCSKASFLPLQRRNDPSRLAHHHPSNPYPNPPSSPSPSLPHSLKPSSTHPPRIKSPRNLLPKGGGGESVGFETWKLNSAHGVGFA